MANKNRFHFQEREELIAAACLALVRLAKRFDPSRLEYGDPAFLFRGWCKLSLFTTCKRAAVAIRCGGMAGLRGGNGYRDDLPTVLTLSALRTPQGDPLEVSHKEW